MTTHYLDHERRKYERCSPNSLRPISYFGSIWELHVLDLKTKVFCRKENQLHFPTDYGHPERAFFSKIRNFWAWADKLGWNFMRHLGYFWPNYKHYFGTVSPFFMGKCSWFSFLPKTLVFRSQTYNSQMLPK